jgi:predicted membrane protein
MIDWDKDSTRAPMNESTGDAVRDRINRDIHDRIRRGRDHHPSHGIIWGGVICAVGLILLLDHMGYISADRLWRFWPLLLIAAGASRLASPGRRAWGVMLIAIGALLQLDNLGLLRFRWTDLWPLVIICVGLMMIWNAIEARKVRVGTSGSGDATPTMNATAVFGGVERRISANNFRRGTVSAVFGGAEIDFRDGDIDGDEATLEVNAIFGGAEIRVPEAWSVEFHGQTIFGGYSDKTRVTAAAPNGPKRKTLFITGTTCFGGVEVKN